MAQAVKYLTCKHKTLTHTCDPRGGKRGPAARWPASLASLRVPGSGRDSVSRNQMRAMVENISVDLWPLHAYTSANMHTTIVKNTSYSVSIPLSSQLSLLSSTAWVPFLPVPSSWKWSSLWLGAQDEGLWGLGWGFSLSGAFPVFQVPHWKRMQSEAKLARQCCLSQQTKQNQR